MGCTSHAMRCQSKSGLAGEGNKGRGVNTRGGSEFLDETVELVKRDERVESVLLPIADGIQLCLKR